MLIFAESLEAKFSSIDYHFSHVISSSASPDSHSRVDVSCQDAISNRSVAAPTPVAVHSEHPPDRSPFASYSDDLGTTLGGPVAVSASSDATSLPRMSFANLMMTIQFFELSSGRVPDRFLDSLRSYVVAAPDFDLAIGGSSLADLIHRYGLRLSDPLDPIPAPSQGGDSIVQFLYHLVASSGSSPLVTSIASVLHHGVGGIWMFLGLVWVLLFLLLVLPLLVLLLSSPWLLLLLLFLPLCLRCQLLLAFLLLSPLLFLTSLLWLLHFPFLHLSPRLFLRFLWLLFLGFLWLLLFVLSLLPLVCTTLSTPWLLWLLLTRSLYLLFCSLALLPHLLFFLPLQLPLLRLSLALLSSLPFLLALLLCRIRWSPGPY